MLSKTHAADCALFSRMSWRGLSAIHAVTGNDGPSFLLQSDCMSCVVGRTCPPAAVEINRLLPLHPSCDMLRRVMRYGNSFSASAREQFREPERRTTRLVNGQSIAPPGYGWR